MEGKGSNLTPFKRNKTLFLMDKRYFRPEPTTISNKYTAKFKIETLQLLKSRKLWKTSKRRSTGHTKQQLTMANMSNNSSYSHFGP